MSYDNPWIYNERTFDSDITEYFGFVYLITNLSQTNDSTLGESIFGLLENLLERKEKLNKKVIGSGIMGVAQN